ncbi:MAG: sphingomyelin phosphodiesterase [Planctomycetales bacterium]|nr:sphingomyelin phosphodiesterase [Planctomycetales bacterium]
MPRLKPSLRVLSMNVKMLPGPGGEKRGRALVRKFLGAEPRFDILCLQEVFDEDIRGILVRGLARAFPHQVPKCDDGDIFQEDSGLFFASRYPIAGGGEAWGFQEFETTGPITGWDYWADKGIFGARVDLDRIEPGLGACVFNTHLQSDPDVPGQYGEVRRAQLRQIARFVARALARLAAPQRTFALLAGDLNIVAETWPDGPLTPTPEYLGMLGSLGDPRDLYRGRNPAAAGFTWDGTQNQMIPETDKDRLRLDYLLALDRAPASEAPGTPVALLAPTCVASDVETLGTTPRTRLSDHFGVSGTLEL